MRLNKILGVLGALSLASVSVGLAKAPRPNILLFLVDDMGVMDTSVPFLVDEKGTPERHPLNEFYRTPAMERLAARGLRFSQFYANSVCSPTRVTLMTGQSSARHKTTQFISPEKKNAGPKEWNWKGMTRESVALPRLLRAAGYRTIHSGKAHFGAKNHEGADPKVIGFGVNIAGCSYGAPGSYRGKDNFGHGTPRAKRAVPGLEAYHGKDIFLTEALTLEINKAITQAVKDQKPFFAYMSHYAVHSPFQSDPRFAVNYRSSGKKGPALSFATMIEGMDKSLKDIMATIDELGVAENTLILFLGDNGSDAPLGPVHGYSSSAPLRGKKGTHYEGGMRVPFIAAWAKPSPASDIQKAFPIKPGVIHDRFASICDVLPTVLAVAGVEAPAGHVVDGTSLWGSFSAKRSVTPQKFLMHFPHGHRSSYFTVYREEAWKLICHLRRTTDRRYELFNLVDDPHENENVASSQPTILKRMVRATQRELDDAGAQYPVDNKTQTELEVN